MTHAQATEHLENGRSVMVKVNGVRTQVSSLKDLPSEAVMAVGNPAKEKEARLNLIAQQAKIAEELRLLGDDPDAKVDETESGTAKRQTAAEKKAAEKEALEIAALKTRQEAGETLTDEEKARLEAAPK